MDQATANALDSLVFTTNTRTAFQDFGKCKRPLGSERRVYIRLAYLVGSLRSAARQNFSPKHASHEARRSVVGSSSLTGPPQAGGINVCGRAPRIDALSEHALIMHSPSRDRKFDARRKPHPPAPLPPLSPRPAAHRRGIFMRRTSGSAPPKEMGALLGRIYLAMDAARLRV
jgi:hypothetical protein